MSNQEHVLAEQPTPSKEFLYSPSHGEWLRLEIEHVANAQEPEREKIAGQNRANREKLAEYLRSILTVPNLLILAGSGTSLGDAGGPSMSDLWAKAKELSDFDLARNAVKHPVHDEWLENLLSRCKAGKQFLDNQSTVDKVTAFLKACEELISKACSDFVTVANLEAHRDFLRRLARRRARGPRLRLFTTNYDTCFERAASELGMIVIDGFSFSSPRRFDPNHFHLDLVRRGRVGDSSDDFIEGVFQLLKLHGSVIWDRIGDDIVQADNPANPCLMYPMNSKFEQTYTQPHLELMAQFQQALREPNTALIVVGFGFNDKHLTEHIRAAVHANPSFKLLVVDPAAKSQSEKGGVLKMLREQIEKGESDIALLNADFSQFAGLIPNLQALSPAEQIERSIVQIARRSQP